MVSDFCFINYDQNVYGGSSRSLMKITKNDGNVKITCQPLLHLQFLVNKYFLKSQFMFFVISTFSPVCSVILGKYCSVDISM